MKKIRYYLFLFIILASLNRVIGQDDTRRQVVPVAPNAASLGKYVEIPVGLYTGIPQINLPLESLKSIDLDLDLSLSYHSSGFRVNEDATSVGLGWSLNAGGVITRVVRGEVDSKSRVPVPSYFDITWGYLFELTQTDWYDNQPDMYYYNFNGISGKFYLSDIGVPIVNDDNNLKITPVFNATNDIIRWKIVNSNGESFVFGENENVDYTVTQAAIWKNEPPPIANFELQPLISHPTAYYLTTIKSVDGNDSIKFEYDKESYKYVSELSYSQDYTIGGDLDGEAFPTYSNIWMDSKRLKSIQSPNWKVNFDCTISREDLNYFNDQIPKVISEIQIYEGVSKLMKRIHLYTSYFLSDGLNTAPDADKFRYKRLRLDSLKVYAPDLSQQIPATKFKYNTTSLPAKYTTAQDLWGLYNGKTSNPVQMLPTIKDFYFLPVGYNDPRIIDINGGSDRGSYGEFMKACNISEIQYATGGTHQFVFEPNIYNKEIHVINNHTLSTGISGYQTSESVFTTSEVFNIPSNLVVVDVYFEYKVATKSYTSGYGSCAINGNPFRIDLPATNYPSYYIQHLPTTFLHTGNNNLNVIAFHGLSKLTIRLRDINNSYQNTIAGGLRILQTVVLDSKTNTSITTNYEYTIHDSQTYLSTGVSSGSIVTEPVYISTYLKPLSETVLDQRLTLSPSPYVELGSSQGGYVGYQEVKVIKNSGTNGSEIYFYTTSKQFPDIKLIKYGGMDATSQLLALHNLTDQYVVNSGLRLVEPFVPLACSDFRRGLLTKTITLNSGNIPLQKEEYSYNFEKIDTISGIKFIPRRKWVQEFGMWNHKLVRVDFNTYKDLIGQRKMSGKIETQFILSDNSSIIKTSNYSYNNSPILIKEVEEICNDKSIKTSFKYPFDYNVSITNISNLLANNLVSLPIKTEKTVSGNQTEGTIIQYNSFGKPTEIYEYKSNILSPPAVHDPYLLLPVSNPMRYEKKETYIYDVKGNLLDFSNQSGIHTSYIWGYNGALPVVKLEGLSYSDISSSIVSNINSHVFTNSASYSSTQTDVEYLKGQLNGVMSLPNIMVSLYTYSPLIGMTSQTDPKGMTIYYEYNQLMQLERVLDNNANILKEYKYHYSSLPIFYNVAKSQVFYKQNCSSGMSPGSYTYSAAANTYSSEISQADADAKAQNDIDSNGQNAANTYGTCYYVSLGTTLLNFGTAGGTQSLSYYSNASCTSTCSASWIYVPSPSGSFSGAGTLYINCSTNTGSARTGSVTIRSSASTGNITKVITINQNAAPSYITANPNSLFFQSVATAQTVTVSSSPTWSVVSTTDDFITATKTNETTLTVRCDKNLDVDRSGTITITNGTNQAVINVTQWSPSGPPQ